MGKAAKLRQARRKFKSGRKPRPDLAVLESRINSVELKEWLIGEWKGLADFHLLIPPEQKDELAKVILSRLYQELASDYNKDSRIEYDLNSHLFVAVGINVYSWTVWAAAGDRLTKFIFTTSDNEEYSLS